MEKIELFVERNMNKFKVKNYSQGFPGGAVVENLPANAGDTGSSPGLGRSHMPQGAAKNKEQQQHIHFYGLLNT